MDPEPSRPPSRRRFLKTLVAAAGAGFAALFGAPSLLALFSPGLRGAAAAAWRPVALQGDLRASKIVPFTYEVEAGWQKQRELGYIVRDGGDFYALSSRCTHAGCRVRKKGETFACPCHGGLFSIQGKPLKGPPTRPLQRFEARMTNGTVEVRLEGVA